MRMLMRMVWCTALGPCHGGWMRHRRTFQWHRALTSLLLGLLCLVLVPRLWSESASADQQQPLPWAANNTAEGREWVARRMMGVVTSALHGSSVVYTVGGATLFNCLNYQNLSSPTVATSALRVDVSVEIGAEWALSQPAVAALRQAGVEWRWVKAPGCRITDLSGGAPPMEPEQAQPVWWRTVFRNGSTAFGYLPAGHDLPSPGGLNVTAGNTTPDHLRTLCLAISSCSAVSFISNGAGKLENDVVSFKSSDTKFVRGHHRYVAPTRATLCLPRLDLEFSVTVGHGVRTGTSQRWTVLARTVYLGETQTALPDPDAHGRDVTIVASHWVQPAVERPCGSAVLPTPNMARSVLAQLYGNLGECPLMVGGHAPCVNLRRTHRLVYWSNEGGSSPAAVARLGDGMPVPCPGDDAAVPKQLHQVWMRWGRGRVTEEAPLEAVTTCHTVYSADDGWRHSFWMLPSIPLNLDLRGWVQLALSGGRRDAAEVLLWLELLRAYGGVARRANMSCHANMDASVALGTPGVAVATFSNRILVSLTAPRMHWGVHQTIEELSRLARIHTKPTADEIATHLDRVLHTPAFRVLILP